MSSQTPAIPRIANRAEAEDLVAEIGGLLEKLANVIGEETRLVRSAKIVAATALADTKSELARRYAAALERLKANAGLVSRFAPVSVDQLRRRNAAFQADLQVNMAVLATIRSVSEGLVRNVAMDVAQKSAPRTYGKSGNMAMVPRSSATPVSLSRVL